MEVSFVNEAPGVGNHKSWVHSIQHKYTQSWAKNANIKHNIRVKWMGAELEFKENDL
jgi:hypothetical protein